MPLHQLCGTAARSKRTSGASSGSAFNEQATNNTQEICEVKVHSVPQPLQKSASQASTISFSRDICRICHSEDEEGLPLISPCYCAGSLRFVHQSCLQQWIKSSNTKACELCKFVFIMNSKVKPFSKWERLDISSVERRKILCSVTFHVITITFVVFSLNVLIQRTSQEVHDGSLEWPFWTKVIVVAIAFTGSIVFVYVQCKMYVQLCQRWRAYNRVIYVQNAPEKMPLNRQKEENNFSCEVVSSSKDTDSQGSILGQREKRASIITTSSLQLEPNCTLSSISTSLSPPRTPEGLFDQSCPPGAVDWHLGSAPSTPAPIFTRAPEPVRKYSEQQTLVSLSSRSSSSYSGTPQIRIVSSSSDKSEAENPFLEDYPRYLSSTLAQADFESKFVHTPANLTYESASPDLSDVETLHLDGDGQ